MTSPLRIASAGLGWVARHRHIPAILRNPDLQLIGVIDRHDNLAAQVAHIHGVHHHAGTQDLARIPWLDEVDAIAIGTAPMAHHALAMAALKHGKHVLTEKPFAMNVAEGEEMVATAKSRNRVLAVMHNFQFARAGQKLARDLAGERLGRVNRISAMQLGNPARRLPKWYPELPFGLFFDESPHFFYLLRKFAGAKLHLKHAHALKAGNGGATPASVHIVYRTDDARQIPVTVDCNFESPISEWYLAIYGEKAIGILDIFRDIYMRLPNDGDHALPQILRTSFLATAQHWIQHIPNGIAYLQNKLDYGNDEVFRRFAQAMRAGTPPRDIDAEAALDVLRRQHEAIAAAQAAIM